MDSQKPAGDDSFAAEEDGDFAAARIREVEAMRTVREAAGRLTAVQFLNGAEWIRNVALFTAVNTALTMCGAGVRLIFASGMPDFMAIQWAIQFAKVQDGAIVASDLSTMVAIQVVVGLAFVGIFLGLAKAATARKRWAFWLAIGLFVLDGGAVLLQKDLLEAACHGFAIYKMWTGLSALKQLEN